MDQGIERILVPGFLGSKPTEGHSATACKYLLEKPLGRGAFGEVWVVRRATDQHQFTAKVMFTKNMSETHRLRAKTEIRCLAICEHFGCVGFEEEHEENGVLILIMEYCDGGDLSYQISRLRHEQPPRYFTEDEVQLILVQLVLALHYMHSKKILHRDLKPANVMVTTKGLLKIGDFGLSSIYETIADDPGKTFCGTPYYLAPELWCRRRYGRAADIWSLGVVMYEVMTWRVPFQGKTAEDIQKGVLHAEPEALESCVRRAGHSYSVELCNLIMSMLRKDPKERPDTNQLVRTPLIHSCLEKLPAILRGAPSLPSDECDKVMECFSKQMELIANHVPPTHLPSHRYGEIDTNMTHRGPVMKFKAGTFRPRYLVLRNGGLEILSNEAAVETANKTARSGLALEMIELVQEFPEPVNPGGDKIFAIQTTDGNCFWFLAKDAAVWVEKLNEALGIDG